MLRVLPAPRPGHLLRASACAAVLGLALAGCGGSGKAAAKGDSSTSPSGGSSSGSAGNRSASPQLQAVIDRVEKAGSGTFTQSDSKVDGTAVSSSSGRYSLQDDTIEANVKVPDSSSGRTATALVRVVGDKAFLQVDQWKKPSRSCWLSTTTSALSSDYALDVSSAAVPLAVVLINELTFDDSSGEGTYQGHVPITAVLPLLSGTVKQQLEKSKPQGEVPVFVTDDGSTVTVTVPGYTLASALAKALNVDDSSFTDIEGERYVATARPGAAGAAVQAPATDKQMSPADLQANRCG